MTIIKIITGLFLLSVFAYFSWLLYRAKPEPDVRPSNISLPEYLLIIFIFFVCPIVGLVLILNSVGFL